MSTAVLPLPDSLSRLGDAGAGGPAGDSLSRFRLLRQLICAALTALHTSAGCDECCGALARRHPQQRFQNARPRRARKAARRAPDLAPSRLRQARPLGVAAETAAESLLAGIGKLKQRRPGREACLRKHLAGQTVYRIDLSTFTPCGERLDLDLLPDSLPDRDNQSRNRGHVGTLEGSGTFLRALSLLAPDLPDRPVRGYIIGDAQYKTGQPVLTCGAENDGGAPRRYDISRVIGVGFYGLCPRAGRHAGAGHRGYATLSRNRLVW